MNTTIFTINYDRLVQLLLPTFLRTPLITVFLQSLIDPVKGLYNVGFRYFRETNLFKISITSSVCRLEYLLNSRYYEQAKDLTTDRNATRIRIADVEARDVLYIYQAGEIPEKNVLKLYTVDEVGKNPLFLYTKRETGETIDDFIVKVPGDCDLIKNGAGWDEPLYGIIRSYMLQDKKFSIVTG